MAHIDADGVRGNLERVRERIGDAVEICAAIKYVDAKDLPALAEAGITLVGENRAQDLAAKQDEHGDLFEWDFIGALQSRKVKDVAPRVRLIHSVASESALAQLEKHPAKEILVQVNVAGEKWKAGIAPDELGGRNPLLALLAGHVHLDEDLGGGRALELAEHGLRRDRVDQPHVRGHVLDLAALQGADEVPGEQLPVALLLLEQRLSAVLAHELDAALGQRRQVGGGHVLHGRADLDLRRDPLADALEVRADPRRVDHRRVKHRVLRGRPGGR